MSLILGTLAALIVALSACGGGGSTRTSTAAPAATSKAAATVSAAPVYRVGQYCQATREARYRRFGFTCHHRHLRAA
jgi:hypothetical protein